MAEKETVSPSVSLRSGDRLGVAHPHSLEVGYPRLSTMRDLQAPDSNDDAARTLGHVSRDMTHGGQT